MTDGQTTPPRPKVDDGYWFDFSEQLVTKSADTLDQSAAKLQTLVTWLWGIYTASAAAGFALAGHKLSIAAKFWIALPSLLLTAVYFSAVWVQSPVSVQFDPRSPSDIRLAHRKVVATKNSRGRLALFFGLLASLSVGVALIAASMAKDSTNASPSLEVAGHRADHHKYVAVLGAAVGLDSLHLVVLRSTPNRADSAVFEGYYQADQNGLLQTSVRLDSGFVQGTVALEFHRPKGLAVRLSKAVDFGK